jgi:hypothetical protein
MSFQFAIKFPIKPSKVINESDSFCLIGSCFSENIGQKLLNAGFNTSINPYGILFNPISIHLSIERIIYQKTYQVNDLYQNQEKRYVSFHHHGQYSGFDEVMVIDQINNAIHYNHAFLKTANTLIITYGSAWIYEHLETNQLVANCHKIPNNQFAKRLLDVNEIVNSMKISIELLRKFNPTLNLILTISPVKHLRDGVIENQQSKATLILAMMDVLNYFQENISYFPSYEIVNDELRDYRFYEADYCHPNQLAIDYIWQRFKETYFSDKALVKSLDAENLTKALNHKPLHTEIKNHTLDEKINAYLKK